MSSGPSALPTHPRSSGSATAARPRATAANAPSATGAQLNRRLAIPLGLAVGGANLIGAIAVFTFATYVLPNPTPISPAVRQLNLYVFIGFMALAMPAGTLISRAVWAPVRRWLVEDRAPDPAELRLTLRQPLRQAAGAGTLWLLAAATFAALNAPISVGQSVSTAVSGLLGGVVTCSISYLLVERLLRPVSARALAGGPPEKPAVPGVATRVVLAWAAVSGVVLLAFALVAVLVLSGAPTSARALAVTVLVLSLFALAVGMATVLIAARSLADPVESVRAALAEVEAGNIDVQAPVYDGSEVGLLQAGFNRMVAGLREREQLRDLFGRHVGEDVARRAVERGLELGGEVRDVAVLFVDIVGSTSFAASRDARVVVDVLNHFFGIVVEAAREHGGWVNKFEGDAALCVFGAPTPHEDAAAGALAAGRRLQERLGSELPAVEAAIGVSAGPVVAGNVGAAERFEYTVIGDPVNEAARLTELAKTVPGRLLASDSVVQRAGPQERERWELGHGVTLRGRTEPTRLATPRPVREPARP